MALHQVRALAAAVVARSRRLMKSTETRTWKRADGWRQVVEGGQCGIPAARRALASGEHQIIRGYRLQNLDYGLFGGE
mgnify:CR=1 FL=1